MRPRPIRLGGLPTGVSRPPTLAPYASMSMIGGADLAAAAGRSLRATLPWSCSSLAITPRMPSAVGSSMATVAVFETNADSRQVITPNATITPVVDCPTRGSARMRNANRRARPCLSIAWARMNAPMKVNTVEEPNGAEHVVGRRDAHEDHHRDAEQTADRDRAPPRVTHSTITPSSTPARVCCCGGMSSGSARKTIATTGARKSPTVRRPFSNRSSPGESRCSPRLR